MVTSMDRTKSISESFDQKLNRAKSDTSSSFGAVATKAKDSLEALILKTEKRKEKGLKSYRNKEETKYKNLGFTARRER